MKKILLLLLVASVACIAFLPSILSSPWVKEKLVELVNRRIPGRLEVENLSLSWLGPQKIEGITLSDSHPILSIASVTVEGALWNPGKKGTLQGFQGTLQEIAPGVTNWQVALGWHTSEGTPHNPVQFKGIQATWNEERVEATGESDKGPFSLQIERKNGAFWAKGNDLPTLLLDQIVATRLPEQAGIIEKSLGESLNFESTFDDGQFTFKLTSPFVQADIEGETANMEVHLKNGTIVSTNPLLQGTIQLSRGSFEEDEASIEGEVDLQGESLNAKGHLTVRKGDTWSGTFRGTAGTAHFQATGTVPFEYAEPTLTLHPTITTSRNTEFAGTIVVDEERAAGNLQIEGLQGLEPLQAHASYIFAEQKGQFNAKGSGIQLQGEILENKTSVQGELQQFPIAETLRKMGQEKYAAQAEAIMGPTANGTFNASSVNARWTFAAKLRGDNGSYTVQGGIQNERLFLTAPLEATVRPTRQLSDLVLDELIPLLNSMLQGDQWLSLTIHPEGTSIPLDLSNKQDLQVGQTAISLGKLQFAPEGRLGQVLTTLRKSSQGPFNVWFTPIYLTIQNGVVNLPRFDMLISDTYPIATWGQVDLPGDRVDLKIGLTSAALSRALGLPPLPLFYSFALPLRGPIDNPKLETGKIATKVATLAALTQTTPPGFLIGLLLSQVTSDTLPPPTTDPLPWRIAEEGASTETPETSNVQPLKQIKDTGKKLIKGLFGQ